MKSSWNLDPKEVHWYGGRSTTTIRNSSRKPRIADARSAEINLVHDPTGIEIKGSIPTGHYSKKDMTKLHKDLYQKLFSELEDKVAKFLKIAKR
jgi:hypothetical protein